MALNAASILVRIGCDATAFSSGIGKAERDATRGFNTIKKAGEELSLAFTAPFILATGAMAKMAAEAEDANARVDRVFGDMAGTVKKQLEEMTAVIPETVAGMQELAVRSDNMLQGLGYGAEKASSLGVSMVKLAGDMAAFAHVPIGDALDALDKGLAGKTRGLLQFGITVSAQQIHLEALRRGLLDNHRTLTELGTAEIAESLIRQAATRITGEAERTAGQASNTFKFLKRDVEELGDKIGGVLLPSVAGLAKGARDLVDAVSKVPPDLIKFMLAGAAAAAVVGPLMVAIGNLAKTVMILRTAYAAISGMGAAGAIFGAIVATPFTSIVVGIGAVTTALYGYYQVWRLFSGAGAADAQDAEESANDRTRTFLIKTRHAPLKKTKPDGALNQDSRTALDIFKSHAALVEDQYKNATDVGASLVAPMEKINALHAEAVDLLAKQNGKWTEMAKAAAEVVRVTQGLADVAAVAGALTRGDASPQLLGDASRNATSPSAIALGLANKAIGDETALRTRETALRLQDTFNAVREAGIQMGEQIRNTTHDLAVRAALLALPDGFDAVKTAAVQLGEELRNTTNDLALRRAKQNSPEFYNFGDVAGTAKADVTDASMAAAKALAARLAAIKVPFDAAGEAAAQFKEETWAAADSIKLQFQKLIAPFDLFKEKLGNVSAGMQATAVTIFNVATALAQQLAQQLAGGGRGAGIGGMIGGMIGGLKGASGGLIFGPLGAAIGAIGGALIGGLFDHPKKAADTAAQSLDTMATAAQQVTNSLLNVPQGFKVALEAYRAQVPQVSGAPWFPGSSGGAVTVIVNGSTDPKATAREVLKAFRNAAQNTYANPSRWPDLMAI